MFFNVNGELHRVLVKTDAGVWAISYDDPAAPCYISEARFSSCERVFSPSEYLDRSQPSQALTASQRRRLELIEPLLQDDVCITDADVRRRKATEVAEEQKTTARRVLRIYYNYLARKELGGSRQRRVSVDGKYADFKWAIETFYFSAKKYSLRTAYELMLSQRYTTMNGFLMDSAPSWHSFRHYYYDKGYHNQIRKTISRHGLSNYQRNERLLTGSAMSWRDKIGTFQMDATEADIYLVSRYDRSAVIGRPYIYLAVDTVTQLITGVYVGLKSGDEAVVACLANAATDKVAYCRSYGVDIRPEQWPNTGLPGEIVTDKGREFTGRRIDELCVRYGLERETLPPFRPDCKGLVEKAFDLIQERYKPLLRGKGVIESDAQERWSVDYRSQASLDLDEFTRVVLHCIVYINSHRILKSFVPSPEMIADGVQPISSELWQWYENMGRSVIIPATEDELYQLTLRRTDAKLTRRGIAYDGLWYTAQDYNKYVQEYGLDKSVPIAYDTEKVDRIYLLKDGQYIPFSLASSCGQYLGLSAMEYAMFRRKSKSQKNALQIQETEARVAVMRAISDIADGTDRLAAKRQCGADIRLNRENEGGQER